MIKKILFALLIVSTLSAQVEKDNSSLNLKNLNLPTVTIGGSFIINGSFPLYPAERVDAFVTRIFNQVKAEKTSSIKDFQILEEKVKDFDKYARRDIVIKKYNGHEIKVDLEEFRLIGNFDHNPYLSPDDLIIFPSIDINKHFVSIYGAVNNPTIFQFVKGDRLSTAVRFALGLDKSYEKIEFATISRLSYDGQGEEFLKFTIDEDPLLQMGDRINVPAAESQKKDYKIVIAGEVKNPGKIPITKNSTTLREAIMKAGGFSENADLYRAELIRGGNVFKSTVFTEEFENLLMNRMAEILPEDSIYFQIDNKLRFSRGNGAVDFTKLEDSSSEASSFIVKDGDYIFIPEKLNLVYVFGQVKWPGYVECIDGKDIQYYISQTGGIGQLAKDEIYVIKGKSRSWFKIDEDNGTSIEGGDFIWIPKETPRSFDYYLDRIQAVSSVVGTVATILLLIVQLGK
ncbi:MAG: SLBB domain-containing protein [Bacteroidota bacterium]|nr:SLBB domain-containing protein [Bacteroidota bacterium]